MESRQNVWTVLSLCAVCGKRIDSSCSPQLLPCCHSACRECIDDQLAAIQDLINTNNNDHSLSKCKICSQEYSPNDCIENTFQKIYWSKKPSNCSEVSEKICQSCEGQNKLALIRCQVCDWICADCLHLHKTIKALKAHALDESTKIDKILPNNTCSEHNELLTVYCKTCKIAYCTRCILKDHNLHVYEDTKDSEQLKQFYDNFTKQVNQIKEKRSFTENTLEKFETIESDICEHKRRSIEKIKSITNRLQEKVADLGTSMLDKVNSVCQQKETEFSAKKSELTQLNNSFKYIEEFMSAIMELNDPMGVMRAQDLLNNQLERLLNKPCSHPDFVKPFKIDVIDALEDASKTFSVGKMIDGVFNMCFKIKTSDDPIEKAIEVSGGDEEIVEIRPVASQTPKTHYSCRGSPVVTTSVSQISYANPQVYRGPNANQLNQSSLLNTTSVQKQQNYVNMRQLNPVQYSNPSNVTIHNSMPFTTNSIRLQQIPQQIPPQQQQQLQLQQIQPIQQTPFNQNIRTYTGGTITLPQNTAQYRPPAIAPRPHQQQQHSSTIPVNNPQLVYHLQMPSISKVPMTSMIQMQPSLQSQNNQIANIATASPITNQQYGANITKTIRPQGPLPLVNTQTQRNRSNSSPRDIASPNTSYQTYIPEQTIVRNVIVPQQNQITSNINQSADSRRNSAQSNTPHTPPIVQNGRNDQSVTNTKATNENIARIQSRSQSTDSGIQSPLPSTAVLNRTPVEAPQNEAQTEKSTESTKSTSDTPAIDSVIPQSNPEFNENLANNRDKDNSNKDENKENKEVPAPSRSTAPVARIAPITPEIDLSDGNLDDQIEEDADCVVCLKEYGEFICCERCPRAFHIDCHVPALKKMPDSAFVCTFCKTLPQSNGVRRGKDKKGLNERQQAICERVLIALLCHKKSEHFKQPENVQNNFDFNSIKKKLEENKYEDESQFITDVQQVFNTFNKRNNVNSEVKTDYQIIEGFFKKLVKEFMPCFAELNQNGFDKESTTASSTKKNRLN